MEPTSRPCPLSPTLARLARSRAIRRGFTLVEILVALGISMVIILTAVTAFRVVSRAIALANEMSTENSLLRIGFQASLEDVDFYHSEADDRAPYGKGFTRSRTLVTDDPSTKQNDMFSRAHFQPVRFTAGTDPDALPFDEPSDYTKPAYTEAWKQVLNPNVMLAHDPRSIDRSFIYGNTAPLYQYRWHKPVWVQGNYALVACTDMRYIDGAIPHVAERATPRLIDQSFPYGTTSKRATFPRDTDARIVSAAPRITVDSELTADVLCPVRTSYNMAIPLLAWQIFDRLSFVGMTEYLSPGTNLFIQDQNGGWPGDGWRSGAGFTSPKGFPETGYGRTCLPALWNTAYRAGSRDIASFLGCDYREDMTWAVVTMPTLAALPGTQTSGFYEMAPCVLQMINDNAAGTEQSRGWLPDLNGWEANLGLDSRQNQDAGDNARNDRTFTSKTVRLPYNVTDVERSVIDQAPWTPWGPFTIPHSLDVGVDYLSKPKASPVLTTTILRLHRLGGVNGVNVTTTTVEDQASGRRIELVCVPYGTTYRGARQHWRLYSPAYEQQQAIGDFYDDAAGPFYVP